MTRCTLAAALAAFAAGIKLESILSARSSSDAAREHEAQVNGLLNDLESAQATARRAQEALAHETQITCELPEPHALRQAIREATGGDAGSLIDPLGGRERYQGPEDVL